MKRASSPDRTPYSQISSSFPESRENREPFFFHPQNGWQFADDNNSALDFQFPITAGLFFQRNGTEQIDLVFQGEFRMTPIDVQINQGTNWINRTFADPYSLGSIGLEGVLERGINPFQSDMVIIPEGDIQLFIDESGQWRNTSDDPVDPNAIEIGDLFLIVRGGEPTSFTFFPQQARPEIVLPLQVFGQGNVGRLDGQGFGSEENLCLVGLGERLVPFRVVETAQDGLIFQTGKVPKTLEVFALGLSRGNGLIGPIDSTEGFEFRDPVWTFRSEELFSDEIPAGGGVSPEPPRDGELRFFSTIENGRLSVQVDGPENWPEGTLLDVTLIALSEPGFKIALATERIRFRQALARPDMLFQIVEFLAGTFGQRDFFDPRAIDFEIDRELGGGHRLTIELPFDVIDGVFDLCFQLPPPEPVITKVTGTVSNNGILTIEGADFGDRADDLCVALVPANGNGQPTGMRALSVSENGDRLLAQVTGIIKDGAPLRVMISRGRGVTHRFIFGFPDLIQNQGIWVWEGLGVEGTVSGEDLIPALAFEDEVCTIGELSKGTLVNELEREWPEHARVRVAFTVNSRERTLDYYAPDLCFTEMGTVDDYAERIRLAVEQAFVQEGMANRNVLRVQKSVSMNGLTTLGANLFTYSP
jgi:hypothetical protein